MSTFAFWLNWHTTLRWSISTSSLFNSVICIFSLNNNVAISSKLSSFEANTQMIYWGTSFFFVSICWHYSNLLCFLTKIFSRHSAFLVMLFFVRILEGTLLTPKTSCSFLLYYILWIWIDLKHSCRITVVVYLSKVYCECCLYVGSLDWLCIFEQIWLYWGRIHLKMTSLNKKFVIAFLQARFLLLLMLLPCDRYHHPVCTVCWIYSNMVIAWMQILFVENNQFWCSTRLFANAETHLGALACYKIEIHLARNNLNPSESPTFVPRMKPCNIELGHSDTGVYFKFF